MNQSTPASWGEGAAVAGGVSRGVLGTPTYSVGNVITSVGGRGGAPTGLSDLVGAAGWVWVPIPM